MGKQKTKGQRRLMARKQKRNKAQKATNLRETLFRDFSDMTPMPAYLKKILKDSIIGAFAHENSRFKIETERKNKMEKYYKEREILFRNFK